MQYKKVYSFTSVIIGLVLLYSVSTTVYYAISYEEIGFYSLGTSFPLLTGLAGVIIFWASGFKKSRLLRVYLCFEIFAIPFIAYSYIRLFLPVFNSGYNSLPVLNLTTIINMACTFFLVTCSTILLWFLSKEQKPLLIYFKDGNETVASFSPAPAGNRFVNRLIDAAIIFLFLSTIFTLFRSGFDDGGSFWEYLVLEIPLLILYYLLFESIFHTTAGKCATNTVIVNEQGERPSFVQILGRTFCRLIPFEAFSFFNDDARGWHDSLTKTYVVKATDLSQIQPEEIIFDAELNQLHQ